MMKSYTERRQLFGAIQIHKLVLIFNVEILVPLYRMRVKTILNLYY